LCAIINQFGGKMKETYGVPVEEIQRGIRAGVRKINVDTDNRLAITGAIRKAFAEKPAEFDPRYYLTPARAAMQKVCEERMKQFGQAGQAEKVPLTSLDDMAKAYAAGKYGDNAKPDDRAAATKK
jgi:fructose-bisphosphate aldolase class II